MVEAQLSARGLKMGSEENVKKRIGPHTAEALVSFMATARAYGAHGEPGPNDTHELTRAAFVLVLTDLKYGGQLSAMMSKAEGS